MEPISHAPAWIAALADPENHQPDLSRTAGFETLSIWFEEQLELLTLRFASFRTEQSEKLGR